MLSVILFAFTLYQEQPTKKETILFLRQFLKVGENEQYKINDCELLKGAREIPIHFSKLNPDRVEVSEKYGWLQVYYKGSRESVRISIESGYGEKAKKGLQHLILLCGGKGDPF